MFDDKIMSNNPSNSNNRLMPFWRPVPIQPPVPSDPRVVNQFHSYETDDSDSDIPRPYGAIYSNTNSPESSTPEVDSPRATPELSSAMRMRTIAHTSRPVQNYNNNGMNYADAFIAEYLNLDGIDDQNNGTEEVSDNEMNSENITQRIVQLQQDQSDEPLRIYLAALRQRVRELDSDAWMYVKVSDRFPKI